jgi:hypothetical protein
MFRIEENNCKSAQRSVVCTLEKRLYGCGLALSASTFSCDPCHRLVLADQHRQTSNFQVHPAAVVAYNAALAVKHFRRTVVLLAGSFVGIDIRHVHSHCWTWAFVVLHILEGNHGHLMREVLAVKEVAAGGVDHDELDVLVPK